MKVMRLLYVLMVVLAIGAGAQATVLYETGFEASDGFSDGVSIGGIGGWVVTDGTIVASSADPVTGSMSALAGGSSNNQATRDVTSSSLISLEVDVKMQDESTNDAKFYIMDGSNIACTIYTSSGQWRTYNGQSVVYLDVFTELEGQYNIKMVADASTHTFDAYVDGVLLGDDLAFYHSACGTTMNQVKIRRARTDGMMVDNLVVTNVPEPATMTLLGLGSLAMLHRRKRS